MSQKFLSMKYRNLVQWKNKNSCMTYSHWRSKIKSCILFSLFLLFPKNKKEIIWKFWKFILLHLKVLFMCCIFFHLSVQVKNLQLKSNLKLTFRGKSYYLVINSAQVWGYSNYSNWRVKVAYFLKQLARFTKQIW